MAGTLLIPRHPIAESIKGPPPAKPAAPAHCHCCVLCLLRLGPCAINNPARDPPAASPPVRPETGEEQRGSAPRLQPAMMKHPFADCKCCFCSGSALAQREIPQLGLNCHDQVSPGLSRDLPRLSGDLTPAEFRALASSVSFPQSGPKASDSRHGLA